MNAVKLLLAALLAAFLAGEAMAGEVPRFVTETETSGIKHTYQGGYEFMVGAGVASFDRDTDGLPDLFFAGGEAKATLYRNKSQAGGALRFRPDSDAGLSLASVTGAYPLDIDGDGITDLAVLRIGENVLMRGMGGCKFERANEAWGFDGGNAWTTAFSATWEKGRDWPTLAFGNFMVPDTVIMGYGDCDANVLYRPRGDGGYAAPLALEPGHCALSMLFSDWNRDGVPDLRVSNDKEFYRGGGEQLFPFTGPGTPKPYGGADGWQAVNIWGMGIASHDITCDGYPEYYLTNMVDNRFEVLAGGAAKPVFRDAAKVFGVAAAYPFVGGDKKPSTGWHAEFGDVNNDGRADLLVVKGNVETVGFVADADPNNLLIQQADGTFREGASEAGVVSFELGRSGALVDLNQDGRLDLVVNNRFAPVEVWRNAGQGIGNWLRLKLKMAGGNGAGVGGWVEVKTAQGVQRREVTVGGGHAGGQWGWLHFGLGAAENAEVRAQWPGGAWGPWMKVAANRFAIVEKGARRITVGNPSAK